jgi:hypothetical protein
MQELDQPRLDGTVLGHAMVALSDLHDPAAFEEWLEELQVGEIVRGTGRLSPQRMVMLAHPADPPRVLRMEP